MQLDAMEVGIIIAVVVLLLLRSAWGTRLLTLLGSPARESTRSASSGDRCIACNGVDVTLLEPMVYRCNACGHEGGEGWAARQEARRAASLRQEEPKLRRASARRDLREARTLVSSALGTIERAKSRSPVVAVGDNEAEALTMGIQLLLEARRKALDAQAKLGVSLGAAVMEVDPTTHELDLQLTNGRLGGIAHQRIVRVFEHGQAMLAAIEDVLRRKYPRRRRPANGMSSPKDETA